MRGNIEVQIEGFLEKSGVDTIVMDAEGQVHEVDGGGARGEFPFKSSKFVIHILLKGFPAPSIFCGVGVWEPDS
jgi:hypothetical protein